MTTLLVIGASKGIGKETVRDAIGRGWTVRALSRDPGKIGISHPRLTLIAGSAEDEIALTGAMTGCDAVVSSIGRGPAIGGWTDMFSKHTAALITAMKASGVRRVIMVTGYGAGDTHGRGGFFYDRFFQPIFLGAIYADKDRAEEKLKESGLDWTIVRPGILNNKPHAMNARAIVDPEQYRLGSISRADVADFMLDEIERPRFLHQTPVLIGA
jgi:putative NADH-flavin reductase